MNEIILAIGTGLIGAALGLVFGMFMRKYMSPRAKELQKALEENESHYKVVMGRLKRRIAEYEQPQELQSFAQRTKGENPEDLVGLLSNELSNIRGLPSWIRPFIPGIQKWLKENPEQVQALVTKFMGQSGRPKELSSADAL